MWVFLSWIESNKPSIKRNVQTPFHILNAAHLIIITFSERREAWHGVTFSAKTWRGRFVKQSFFFRAKLFSSWIPAVIFGLCFLKQHTYETWDRDFVVLVHRRTRYLFCFLKCVGFRMRLSLRLFSTIRRKVTIRFEQIFESTKTSYLNITFKEIRCTKICPLFWEQIVLRKVQCE